MFVDIAPVLNFVFIMAVPIAWFITFMCWIVQKGTDYSHKYSPSSVKKNHNNPLSTVIKYTSEGKQVTSNQISDAKTQLVSELDQLRSSIKLKDSEIERLNQEIANLQTMVQIESLKSELANLKMQATKKPNRKAKN
jgi:thiamine biosynthesis lipoprotein ApbE